MVGQHCVQYVAPAFTTNKVIDGVCYAPLKGPTGRMVFGVTYLLFFYVIILAIFTCCYGRILVVIRRQASVMAGHAGPGSSTAHTQTNQIQHNVVKTTLLVCIFYTP